MNKFTYIDLFAGAGGLSEGFVRAGFSSIAHVEYDKSACLTLQTRIAAHYLKDAGKREVYDSYLRGEISREELYSAVPQALLKKVINAKIGDENGEIFKAINSLLAGRKVDIIIGGPPCQAYSYIGRAALKHKEDDERTTLYIQYGRFLSKYRPKVFVFENVPGLLTAENGSYFRNLKKYYRRLGYEIDYRQLNAYDFGVIQNRKRLILMGWQRGLRFSYPEIPPVARKYFRDDIFSDLPEIMPGENNGCCEYTKPAGDYLKHSGIRNGRNFVSQHISRPHNSKDLAIYRLAIEKLSLGARLKNNHIPEEMRTQKNTEDFLDRFKVVSDVPHTMIAHIAKDGHHFIHPDVRQLRSISVREAARIQSFPDDYYFEGIKADQPRTAAYRQIGNAVPPVLAEQIANAVLNSIGKL